MNADDTALLVVDVQEKLVPAIADGALVVANIRGLIEGAAALGMTMLATEQRPDKLGPTLPELAALLPESPSKSMFSCRECADAIEPWLEQGISRVLIAGIEAHVCVQQTALDLLSAGLRVYVAADAVGSRYAVDKQTALGRMQASGVTLTTAEAAQFEWCEDAKHPAFRDISRLAKDRNS